MSLSDSKFRLCLSVLVCASSMSLAGCQATSNRLARLPGLGWMASADDTLVASYDRSDLPPPSAVTEPYRPDGQPRGVRGIDGSVASFDRPYASTGYPPATNGYQTGPYDSNASSNASRSPEAANSRSQYYDQFTGNTPARRNPSAYEGAAGYGAPSGASSRYSAASRQPANESLTRDAASGLSRYSQAAQDSLGRAQSRYEDTLSQARSRYGDAVDGAHRTIDQTRDAVSERLGNATQALANAASNLRGDLEDNASSNMGSLNERFSNTRQQVEQQAQDLADTVRGHVDQIDSAVDHAANTTREAMDSGAEAYRTATSPRYGTQAGDPRPWRPGSTSDYRR